MSWYTGCHNLYYILSAKDIIREDQVHCDSKGREIGASGVKN